MANKAQADLLTLVQQDTGAEFPKKGNTEGGEHWGPCPFCRAGKDRFHVWPNHSSGKSRYWCRQCDESGDLADYLQKKHGTPQREALQAAGLSRDPPKPARQRVVADYVYLDEDGQALHKTVRWGPVTKFHQEAWNGHGWVKRLNGVQLVLYHLPDLLRVKPGDLVIVCEGEKSANAIASLGLTATTCPMGAIQNAEQWREEWTHVLTGRDVVLLADNDEPGAKHVQLVAAALYGKVQRVRVLNLGAGRRPKYDPADWVQEGGEVGKLMAMINAMPPYEPQKEGWQVYTLADAYLPRPPAMYLVQDLIKLPSLTILYGQPGSMKTMLLADLAACIVAGASWLPSLPDKAEGTARATLQMPVLWADFDNGPRVMHERIAAAAKARNLTADAKLFYLSMPDPWLDMSVWESARVLLRRAQTLEARVVIVDNLRDVSGRVEENSSEMGIVMSHFRRVTEELQGAVFVIHHQRKASAIGTRAGESLRGHSSIEAAIDLALLLEREDLSDEIRITATKSRGADVWPFAAKFTYKHKPNTTDLKTIRFFGIEPVGGKSDAAIRRMLYETIKEQPRELNKNQLAAGVAGTLDVGLNRVKTQIEYLVASGKVVVTIAAKGAHMYEVPKDDPRDEI